jgi:peptide/nickel transport system permease protein
MTAGFAVTSPPAALRRFPRRWPRPVYWWAALLSAMLLAAAVGPQVWTVDPNATNLPDRFAGPSFEHPLGTDGFGRDLLARLLHGARLSLVSAAIVIVCSTLLGLVVGSLAAVIGGIIDTLAARLVDGLLALPALVVALGLIGVFGTGWSTLVVALIATGWPWYARVYRSLVIAERQKPYVTAARALGASTLRIAICHLGPNIAGPVAVVAATDLGSTILGLAAFSFLGLGVAPPTPEWGAMVAEGRQHFQSHPWVIVAPGLAITVTVIVVNLFSDALRDAADPFRRR